MAATEGASRPETVLIARAPDGRVVWSPILEDGTRAGSELLDQSTWVSRLQNSWGAIRFVWHDTRDWYPTIVRAGVWVARCHDLRLGHAILRDSAAVADPSPLLAASEWSRDGGAEHDPRIQNTLFDSFDAASGIPSDLESVAAEFQRQRSAIDGSPSAARLRLLIAAESAGALLAVELHEAGLPWSASEHARILEEQLGPQRPGGGPPQLMAEAGERVRLALGDAGLSLDSPPRVLRALHRVGVLAESTSRWELSRYSHPAIEPLLEYKRMARLASANGWSWLREWVSGGRFRPVYVPGGVVTGRWASSGGGALQLPRLLRRAVRADDGWLLVVADVAQLEPRMLAAMAADAAMIEAGRGKDLYEGIVGMGAVGSRSEAKLALLGAMYGATSGESGRLVPRLRRAFPRAMGLVDGAARQGERGEVVSTWLGRSSPTVDDSWKDAQASANASDATAADEARARRIARDRGRFTRNFVVQGTAAEWALCWLADLRQRLRLLAPEQNGPSVFRGPHLAFFLHDEIIVHTPSERADEVAHAVRAAARTATRLMFGADAVDVPLDLRISESADKA